MWWFLWLLCYLFIGGIFVACMAVASVNRGSSYDEPSLQEIAAIAFAILLWPLMIVIVIVLAFAHASKLKRDRKLERQ